MPYHCKPIVIALAIIALITLSVSSPSQTATPDKKTGKEMPPRRWTVGAPRPNATPPKLGAGLGLIPYRPQDLKSVFEPDTRKAIYDTSSYPWCAICKVIVEYPNGDVASGTGTMVGPHHCLTAAHVIYDNKRGGFAETVRVIPGYDNGKMPFGEVGCVRYITYNEYRDRQNSDYDFAMIITDSDIGNKTGTFGVSSVSDDDAKYLTIHIAGYPGDKDDGERLYYAYGQPDSVKGQQFLYRISTYGGQSGSAIYRLTEDKSRFVVGIHTSGSPTSNYGVRITKEIYDEFAGFREKW